MKHLLKYIFCVLILLTGAYCRGQQCSVVSNTSLSGEMQLNTNIEESRKWPEIRNKDSFLNVLMFRGEILVRDGQFDAALLLYRNMLTLTKPQSANTLNIYNHIVSLFKNAGNYEAAIRTHYYALGLTKNQETQAKMCVNISTAYIELKDYDKALQTLDKAIQLIENKNNNYWMVLAISNKGAIYNAKSNYLLAIAAFKKAYAIACTFPDALSEKNNSVKDMIDARYVTLNNIADSYLKLNMPDSALHYLQLIQMDFPKLSQYSRCFVLTTFGSVYVCKGNHKIAIEYLDKALIIAEQFHYADLSKPIYESLSELYSSTGNFKAAWKYQKEYTKLKDSLTSIENIHKINRLERQYEISINDKELARKELLISKQAGRLREQSWVAGILALVLVSLGCIFVVFRKNHLNRNKLLKEQLNGSIKDQKIMQIEAGVKGEEKERTRIAGDLHDGVVSELLAMKLNLESLGKEYKPLMQSDDYMNLLYQATDVTDRLRMVAHNLMPPNLKGNGLLHTIRTFLDRINNHKIQFTFQHYGVIPEFNEITGKIILMMTMELIQNILKHSRATEAIIQFDFFPDSISITVEDNGVGIGNRKIDNNGIGLSNIETNIKLLNGSLDIRSSEYTGTTVLIEIPCYEISLQSQNVL